MTSQPGKTYDQRYYERITWIARWLSIALVLATAPFSGTYASWIHALVAVAVVYNLLRYSPLMKLELFAAKSSMIATDIFFVVALMALTGGVHSPYYIFFIFMFVSVAYWYGIRGSAVVGAVTVLSWLALLLVHTPATPANPGIVLVLKISALLVIGWHAVKFTEEERQERMEQSSERQRLLTLVDSIGEAVVAIDRQGRVTLCNSVASSLLHAAIGSKVADFVLKDSADQTFDVLAFAHDAKGPKRSDEIYAQAGDGTKVRLEISVSPIQKTETEFEKGYILMLRDITKEKSFDEQRDEFISVASHELRTPLTIAEANTSMLMETKKNVDPQMRELAGKVHESILYLSNIVSDLNNFVIAERGIKQIDLSIVDPVQVVYKLAQDFWSQAEDKGLKLVTDTPPDVPSIMTSNYHIYEILTNLMANALKFTAKGSITIGIRASEKNSVTFFVKDTGAGISEVDQKNLFSKFYRAEDYRTRETGGTGIGLYIAKQLTERLGGKIWVESKLHEGSTFYLLVPPISTKPEDRSQVRETEVADFLGKL